MRSLFLVVALASIVPAHAAPSGAFDGAGPAEPEVGAVHDQQAPSTPLAAAPASKQCAVENLFASPIGSDIFRESSDEVAAKHFSFKLSASLAWQDYAVIAFVTVCDPTPHDPMENFEPCRYYEFSFGRQLKTDLAAHEILRGDRVVAKISETGAGPMLNWGRGGLDAVVGFRVIDGHMTVFLKP
jgi:hypothetical protein